VSIGFLDEDDVEMFRIKMDSVCFVGTAPSAELAQCPCFYGSIRSLVRGNVGCLFTVDRQAVTIHVVSRQSIVATAAWLNDPVAGVASGRCIL
jgi:hypothetical protein